MEQKQQAAARTETTDSQESFGDRKKAISPAHVIRFSGAFVAFMIGSGFATGQEILQFFTAYGLWSIGGIFIAMVLFAWSGKTLMNYGFRHRDQSAEELAEGSFRYYAGKYFGVFLSWFIPLFLFLVVIIMISGSGATIAQYFGAPTWIGSLGMAVLIYLTNLFGFKRIIDVIGAIGPVIIVFTIVIAGFALIMNPTGLANSTQHMDVLAKIPNATHQAPFWVLGGALYVAYNITGSVPFCTQTGSIANSAREAKLGGLLGGILLMTAALLLNLALLAYAPEVSGLDVPNLYFAGLVSPVLSFLFAVIVLCGIFTTGTPMLWSATTRISVEGTQRYKITLTVLTVLALIAGQLPYGALMNIIYPYTGYIGIAFLALVALRQIIEWNNRRIGLPEETPLFRKER
ncbi:MAG: hypothetical protein RSB98_03155 [Raoultibacter sp.]